MKAFLILNIILIILSCGNKSDKNSVKNNIIDSSSVTTQTEKPKTDSVIFSVEDSVRFFTACEEEKKLIDLFCECAHKNGRAHKECRTFIKDKVKYEKIEDEIINKYYIGEFANENIREKLSKKSQELINLFNKCN